MKGAMVEDAHIRIAIGICAYNEEKNIPKLLDNLLTKQDFFQDVEIFVNCSGSNDNTPEIVRKLCDNNHSVKLIYESKRRGKAYALNEIFRETNVNVVNNDPLVLVNADALPEPGSIDKLLQPFCNEKVGATTGRPIPINGLENICDSIVHLIWDLHHRLNLRGRVKMSGELCAIRPDLVKEIPVNLATDEPYMEVLIRRQGYEIVYVPGAVVRMKGPDNLRELFSQRRRICIGHAQIKAMTGFTVSTYDFGKTLFLLCESLKIGATPMGLATVLVGGFLEIVARLAALYDLRRGMIPYIWERLPSTKP